jgi:hypothetical protein
MAGYTVPDFGLTLNLGPHYSPRYFRMHTGSKNELPDHSLAHFGPSR